MGAHADQLKKLGLAIDPELLASPTSPVLGAVVSLGGCSASFVSPEGLVVTNHHCATSALQYSSTPAANLLKDGYVARTRADEKWNGPQARVYVTQTLSDVTEKILAGASAQKDELLRYRLVERHAKDAVAACEKDRPGIRCSVASFYEGATYMLVEQLEIRDVRLVYAPPSGVGNFGGEIDNWRWPRHTGDVSMFRAYVGKDGKPADHAQDNVPYHPPNHLKLAEKGLEEGDLVLVAGYPGRTYSLKTGAEVDEAIGWGYPRRQKLCEEYLARLAEVSKTDKDLAIKATPLVRRYGNALTNIKGQLEGLVTGGLARKRSEEEAQLAGFIDADPVRKGKYGDVLASIRGAVAENARTREADTQLRSEILTPKLLGAAVDIVRMARERRKPDPDRHPDYQERNASRLEQAQSALDKTYARALDEALLTLALERSARSGVAERSPALPIVVGENTKVNETSIASAVRSLYAQTRLEDGKLRLALLKNGKYGEIVRTHDPLLALAVRLVPLLEAAEAREHRLAGKMLLLKTRYIEALRAHAGREIAPDANSTLRITYGTVKGYAKTPDAKPYRPFTLLNEVLAKNTGKEPFDVPERLIMAARSRRVGPYVDPRLGDVPVDFLADLHITGGNSGSATLNARGELTGLVFDGNYEAMASDWLFLPSITRSIHVDLRYVLWLLDVVDGGDHLIKEMGGTPKVE